jgi:D-sedoheptulose 7-phosphate isomerase
MNKLPLNSIVNAEIDEHLSIINSLKNSVSDIKLFSDLISTALLNKKKLLTCGNGGSAADSIHLSSEIVGRYEKNRKGYSAISLASESSALTAIGNDFGFENIFSRQVDALGESGDILILISTSGNSQNLINACIAAKKKNIKVLGLLGRDGGELLKLVDNAITIKSNRTCRIQEAHSLIIHIICHLFDNRLKLN